MTTTAPQDTAASGTLEHGRVVAIAGPVIDVEFTPHSLPEINHAVDFTIELDGKTTTVTAEVAQQIGEGRVRCICMQQTDGLVRGTAVRKRSRATGVRFGPQPKGSIAPGTSSRIPRRCCAGGWTRSGRRRRASWPKDWLYHWTRWNRAWRSLKAKDRCCAVITLNHDNSAIAVFSPVFIASLWGVCAAKLSRSRRPSSCDFSAAGSTPLQGPSCTASMACSRF